MILQVVFVCENVKFKMIYNILRTEKFILTLFSFYMLIIL